MEGAHVGLALFDAGLALVQCNTRYRDLFGYRSEDVPPGALLEDLIRLKLGRQLASPHHIEQRVALVRDRLQHGTTHCFNFQTSSGRRLTIARNRLENGSLVETVREETNETLGFDSGATQLAEMARERLAHALEGMADGFCLYDADDRLVLYNRKYVEFNPHIADLIVPGALYEDMLSKGMERAGFNVGGMSQDEFFQWRLRQHQEPDTSLLFRPGPEARPADRSEGRRTLRRRAQCQRRFLPGDGRR